MFQMKTHVSQQILDLDHCDCLPVAPVVMILEFSKPVQRPFQKVYFYPLLTYSFLVMVLSSKTYHDIPDLRETPLSKHHM